MQKKRNLDEAKSERSKSLHRGIPAAEAITPRRIASAAQKGAMPRRDRPSRAAMEVNNKELREAQLRLRKSRDRYADLFDFAPVGYFTLDRLFQIVEANLMGSRLLGEERQNLTGEKLSAYVHSEHRDAFYRAFKTSTRRRERRCEVRLQRKDGANFFAELKIMREPDSGSHAVYRVSLVDISERRRAEAALGRNERIFRALTENTSEFLGILNTRGRIGYAIIGRPCRLLYTAEELYRRNALEFVHPEDAAAARKFIRNIAGKPGRIKRAELRIRAKDGAWRWMLMIGTNLIHDPDIGGVVINGRDITDIKETEEKLRRNQLELEQRVQERTKELSQAVRELEQRSKQLRRISAELTLTEQRERKRLAQVIHDGLQQILVAACFQLDLVDSGQNMKQELERLRRILDEAGDTSRLLAAELSPPILLRRDLCAALDWLAGWMQEQYGLHVTLAPCKSIPLMAEESLLLLFQSARELLFNIVKHSGVKEARVELHQKDGRIFLTVEDEGIGFDAARLDMQGSGSEGFGLFSIRERLSLMGGRMEIDSAPGRGSCFRLTLPVSHSKKQKAPKFASGTAPAAAALELTESDADMKIRIMLVDDHMIVRQGIANLIRREPDFEIVGEACDGESAVTLAREVRPNVVLMDINMPKMDGIQATQIIHEEMDDVRIIGLSMYQEESQQAAMLDAGAVAYVTKRGSTKELIETIRASVRGG